MEERSALEAVLVVDDIVESAASTAETLGSEGFDVETAETPIEGLDRDTGSDPVSARTGSTVRPGADESASE
jgi:CheY-like chemotaxis protein